MLTEGQINPRRMHASTENSKPPTTQTRGDNISAMFGAESDFITGTRRLSSIPFVYDLVPAICETPVVDRYSPIPGNIYPGLSTSTMPAYLEENGMNWARLVAIVVGAGVVS